MVHLSQMSAMSVPLTDYKLAAAAPLIGGHLERIDCDPGTHRVAFVFSNLPADFLERVFNGDLSVSLRDYIASLEQVQALIAKYKARTARK